MHPSQVGFVEDELGFVGGGEGTCFEAVFSVVGWAVFWFEAFEEVAEEFHCVGKRLSRATK